MGSGQILTHLGVSSLRIFFVLLTESSVAVSTVDATASTASPPVECKFRGRTEMVIIVQFVAGPLLSFSEVSQVRFAVSVWLTCSPLQTFERARPGTFSRRP